jgi:hypothetical protein
MADNIDPKLLDKRIVARLIKDGLLSEKDYERHLKSLPDLAEQATIVESTLEPIHVTAAGSHPDEE